jgi:RimJ/RimL family protein N-acetyltransferase
VSEPRPPILLDLPSEFDTARLTIRVPRPGDGRTINAAVVESVDTLLPWMPWAKEPTLDSSETWARRNAGNFHLRNAWGFTLWLKGTETVAGSAGFAKVDWEARVFEIGYWVRTSLQRQGYAREATEALFDYAVRHGGARRVEIRCDSRNEASRRVALACGFEMEGTLRNDALDIDGKSRDTCFFSRPV